MPANEGGTLLALWVVARRIAAPLIPLLLGAAAMALLLDSGTVHLPPIRSSAGAPSSAPAEKIVVTSPTTVHRARHEPATPAKGHTRTSAASGPAAAGSSAPPLTSSASATTPSSSGTHATSPKRPPVSAAPAPTKPVQQPAPPAADRKATKPPEPRESEKGAPHLTPPGYAVAHRTGPPPGHGNPHGSPPGHAFGHRHGAPPGHEYHVPPGQAKKANHPRPHHSQGHEEHGRGHGDGRDHAD